VQLCAPVRSMPSDGGVSQGRTRQPHSIPPSVSTPSHRTTPIQSWTLT
jgi:hypothetical protein